MTPQLDVLTTGQVAEICQVAPRTVSKWFDEGLLPGFKIPGSKDRRIAKQTLIEFMERHQMTFLWVAHQQRLADRQLATAFGKETPSTSVVLE